LKTKENIMKKYTLVELLVVIGLFLGPTLLALGQVLIREWLALSEQDEPPSI
jgi:predicted PurR-regulated permease PerM